jgi:hypothetical protein
MRSAVKRTAVALLALSLVFTGLGIASATHEFGFFNFIVQANINDNPAVKLQNP